MITSNMKTFELQQEHKESIAFDYTDNHWSLRTVDETKTKQITDFCVDLCIKSGMRTAENTMPYLAEHEVLQLITFFRSQGYNLERRDTELEKDLKNVYEIMTKGQTENILPAIELLSYNEQMELMSTLAKTPL